MTQSIEKDIKFDRYGDISFIGNDIDIISNHKDILYQNIIDRLITNFDDYELYPSVGANLSSFIGRSTIGIESSIQNSVLSALTSDSLLEPRQITMVVIREAEKVFMKISIRSDIEISNVAEEIIINAIYNTSSGMFYATN